MSLPDVNDSLAYTGRPVRRSGSSKRTLSQEDLSDVLADTPKETQGASGGSVKRTKSMEKVRYSYIDPEWEYDPETLDERLSESNAKEAGIRDIDEGSKRNSLGRKRKSWLKDHENEPSTEPPVEMVKAPDPGPTFVLEPAPDLEPEAAMAGDENPSKDDLAASEDELEEVVEQEDVVYETFLDAYGNKLQRMEESLRREKEGILDELTGGISSSNSAARGRVEPSVSDTANSDMSPVVGQTNNSENPSVDYYYDPNQSMRQRHDGPGISPDAILASMIMEKLSGQKPIRARVGRRLEDEQDFGSKENIPTLPYRTYMKPPPGLPPDGPPHYSPRVSGRGRGHPMGPNHHGPNSHGPYHRPGERPTPAPRPQPQQQQRAQAQPKSFRGPIIHGARPDGLPPPPPPPDTSEPEPELIPDPVTGAVEAALEKKNRKAPPEEYTGYYIETCVGVDEDFYHSPKKNRLRASKRDYSIDELAHRARNGASPEIRAKSLERGLEDARREEMVMEWERAEGASTLERGRERERVNRARKQLMKEEGSQGSLDGSKERIKPAIAPKPKISDKLRQEFRNSSQERPQTPTATDTPKQDQAQRTSTIETGPTLTLTKKEPPSGTSTIKTGTVEKTVVKTTQQANQSSAIEVVELSDTSSVGSSRPTSRPGSAGETRPTSFGRQEDFMYNAMLQQTASRQGATRPVPRSKTTSMDRSMTREQTTTASKQMKRSQTSSMDRSMARKAFFEPLGQDKYGSKDEEKKPKGAHDRSSSYSSYGSDKDSPRTPVVAEVTVENSSSPGGPVVSGTTPGGRSGPVIAGSTSQSVKISGGPVIAGLMPETAMEGSVDRSHKRKKDGRVATPLVLTKASEQGKKGTVERGEDDTKDGQSTQIITKTPEVQSTRDGTQGKHFKKRNETVTVYNERVKKAEASSSFRESESSDSFRTPNRELQYDMDVSTTSNNISHGSHKTPKRSGSKERGLDETAKSGTKDRKRKETKDRKGQIRRDDSFDSPQYSMQSDRSDTTYGQDSMTQAVVRGAVRDTVHDNMFGQETTLSPVTPGTQWSVMDERFSDQKGKKDKKSKGGFFSFGSKRKPKRSRENSLDSTLDTTMDSTFDNRSMASMTSQDTLNDTVRHGERGRAEKKERERSKDRTVKGKDKNRRVKEKEALKEVTNQDMDSIQGIFIEGDDDLLKKEDLERIGHVPMEMTSTPDRQRKVKKKPKSSGNVEVIDMRESPKTRRGDRSREERRPQDENADTEYTTTKDVMNAMFAGAVEGKKRSPRKKSRERKDRKEEDERLHVTEISIDEMLKEREITMTRADKEEKDDTRRRRTKERHREAEHSSSRTHKHDRDRDREDRHREKDGERDRTRERKNREKEGEKDGERERTRERKNREKEGDRDRDREDRHREKDGERERTRERKNREKEGEKDGERERTREHRNREKDDRERTKESTSRTRKDSEEEEREIVRRTTTKTDKSGRFVKKKDKEPSDATRAIMSELLRQVATPGRDEQAEGARENREEVVYRKEMRRRQARSEERRRERKRQEEERYRNGEVSDEEGRRRELRNDYVRNGVHSFEEYKIKWDEYPEDDEFEKSSFSGFDVSLDEVIEEREYRKSEVFRMLLEDTAFEKKLRRLAEKRAREAEKAAETGSEGTGSTSTPRSADRSSAESLDEVDLLRELEKKIEEYFERQKQKKIQVLLKKFMAEEGGRMSKLLSHSDEVLDLIALKDRELYGEIIEPQLPAPPPVEPPECSRSVLYVSADVFEELDTEVIGVAQLEQASYIELVRDLTRKCKHELDRIRAIFRWITVKDLSKIRFDEDEKINPDSLLGMLKGIKEGKASYHDLFKRLCGYAGIHCHVIQGYSKGAGYRPGMKVEHKAFRNTWTAVSVNKSWRFVNCNWGARHYKHSTAIKQETAGKDLCYKCDEFYFLTDPEDHIFQHFPDDKKWQLLRHPITVQEFMRLPVLKSPFFNAGLLKPQRKLEDRIYTNDGRVEIAFKMRKFPGLHCTLELIEGKTVIPEPEGHSLVRIIDDEVIFLVAPPDIGRYFFNIYVAENWKSNSLEHAAAFLIIAGDDCFNNSSYGIFPSVGVIGKTPVMSDLGIGIPREQDPYLLLSCNTWTEVTLPFTLKRDVKLSHQMKLFNRQGKYVGDYDQFVFLKYKGSKSYCVRCPREGIYALSVFAGDAKDRSPKLECTFKYLIDCEAAKISAPPFPKPSRKWIGCTLHEPISGELDLNTKVKFGVEVPDAVEVAVVIGDKWQSLEFSEHTEDLWEGKVHTGSKPGLTATVFARYDEDSDKFSPLLDYTVIDSKSSAPKPPRA